MEWLLAPTSSLLLVVLVVPMFVVVGAAILLMIGQVIPGGQTLSRVAFHCPFSKRRATVEFLTPAGGEQPTDVLSCSVFDKPYHVRCEKGCLTMARTGWTSSPLMPRFALLADGVTLRPVGRPDSQATDGPTDGGKTRTT